VTGGADAGGNLLALGVGDAAGRGVGWDDVAAVSRAARMRFTGGPGVYRSR
jgi:hypothetical protein